MTDAHVHADHARPTVRGRNGPLDFDGERHVPAVGSWVLTTPILGSWTCLRSGSTRTAPVVNRQATRARRFFFLRGKPIGRPLRSPLRESLQFLSARASAS